MRGFYDVELHAVMHGVRVHLPETHHLVVEYYPRIVDDQPLRVRGKVATLSSVENPLLPHVVRRGSRRGR